MNPSTINPDEMLKSMAAQAVKQHEQIRTTIRDLTLKTLQARDLSLEQINGVVRNITAGVNIGVGDTRLIRNRLCRMRLPEWMMPCSKSSKPISWHCRN